MHMLRCTTSHYLRIGAVLIASFLAAPLQAEAPRTRARTTRPAVIQMEIYNGPSRTVRIFGSDISPGEMASLSDLERLENEASFAQDVQALKNQYVVGERILDPHRRVVQQELYGRAITRTNYDAAAYGGYGYGYGYGYGVGGYGLIRPSTNYAAVAGGQTTEFLSLADGVGDEGVLKSALAGVIAKQAVSTYAATVARDYQQAVSTAALSPRLQAGLRLPTADSIRRDDDSIRAASDGDGPRGKNANRYTLTLMDGTKVVGTEMDEGKEWVTIKRLDGGKTRYRLSQVTQIDLPGSGTGAKNRPATDD